MNALMRIVCTASVLLLAAPVAAQSPSPSSSGTRPARAGHPTSPAAGAAALATPVRPAPRLTFRQPAPAPFDELRRTREIRRRLRAGAVVVTLGVPLLVGGGFLASAANSIDTDTRDCRGTWGYCDAASDKLSRSLGAVVMIGLGAAGTVVGTILVGTSVAKLRRWRDSLQREAGGVRVRPYATRRGGGLALQGSL